MCRIGIGTLDPALGTGPPLLALFVLDDVPTLTVLPALPTPHVPRAAAWALNSLGHPHHGGRLILIADPPPTPTPLAQLRECLVAIMAVDDALAGGHRPAPTPGTGLAERTLHTPAALAALATSTGIVLG
ncbi:hypothetical protein [Kutzneria sp. NPDC052558]|uniref:hypothetical protein n=1 Tax=Kutzneria sp. NPDC052558 TaxID=3364121 RepID=UPI0037CC13F4